MATLPSFLSSFLDEFDKTPLTDLSLFQVFDMIVALYAANEKTCGMTSEELLRLLYIVFDVIAESIRDAKKASRPAPLPEDWDLAFPVLKLRKDIWENFPVMCLPLGRGSDGAERHAIVWHRKNFADWRAACEDFFEAMDYEEITTYRLFKCLEASKHWTVEPAQTSQQICVIRMNFTEESAEAAPAPAKPAVTATPAEESGWSTVGTPVSSDLPILTRINDITAEFPIVWNNESRPKMSARPGDIISLSVFNRKLREMPPAAAEACLDRLMRALRASSSWRVIRGQGSEFCRLEMA